jgi:peptidoglycan/xylan/chitin deacetylase (PgdA/CDA1 family)
VTKFVNFAGAAFARSSIALRVFVRRLLKSGWIHALLLTGALRSAKRRLAQEGGAVVLTLHRVLPDQEFNTTSTQRAIVVRSSTFSSLATYLHQAFELIDLSQDSARCLQPGSRLKVAITFDDGWRDNFFEVQPISSQAALPWTVFFCPGLEGQNFPFWPDQVMAAYKVSLGMEATDRYIEHMKEMAPSTRTDLLDRIPTSRELVIEEPGNATMTWSEIRALHANGVAIGSHTQNHRILNGLDRDSVNEEVISSKSAIESALQAPCLMFAYPNGNCDPLVRQCVDEAGYLLAFTTDAGVWTAGSDPLMIPRNNLSESKITDWRGRFSRAAFDYEMCWKPARLLFRGQPCRFDPKPRL